VSGIGQFSERRFPGKSRGLCVSAYLIDSYQWQSYVSSIRMVLNMTRPGTFQKGHKLAIGSRGQIRRDLTIELISQLNEIFDKRTGQTNLQLVVSNLIALATGADEYDKKGNLVKRGTGDLAAIKEIFDRIEGRVPRATRSSVSQSGSTRQPSISSVNMPWQAYCSATGSASPTSNGSTASIPRKS
jgi:hypothetical protein